MNGHVLNNNIDDSAPLDDTFPIDMDLIDRIEIVRGPSSSLYGADAFFAVVNVITRTGKNMGATVSAECGSLGTYKETVTYGLDHHGTQALFSESYNITNTPGQLGWNRGPGRGVGYSRSFRATTSRCKVRCLLCSRETPSQRYGARNDDGSGPIQDWP